MSRVCNLMSLTMKKTLAFVCNWCILCEAGLTVMQSDLLAGELNPQPQTRGGSEVEVARPEIGAQVGPSAASKSKDSHLKS